MPVESRETVLGYVLPQLSLPDSEGEHIPLRGEGARATLVAFVCNHCPFVKHVEKVFGEMATTYMAHGVAVRAVVSNDLEISPEDGPEGMKEQASRAGWSFPYLQDRDQSVARELGAVCTPDFFLFDADYRLVYRGGFCDSTPGNDLPLVGGHLRGALDLTLAGEAVPLPHKPAMGCGIKWSSESA